MGACNYEREEQVEARHPVTVEDAGSIPVTLASEPFQVCCVLLVACVRLLEKDVQMWRELLDPVDHEEFERMCEGKPVSTKFEEFLNRSEVLQELFEEVMRTDSLGLYITRMIR